MSNEWQTHIVQLICRWQFVYEIEFVVVMKATTRTQDTTQKQLTCHLSYNHFKTMLHIYFYGASPGFSMNRVTLSFYYFMRQFVWRMNFFFFFRLVSSSFYVLRCAWTHYKQLDGMQWHRNFDTFKTKLKKLMWNIWIQLYVWSSDALILKPLNGSIIKKPSHKLNKELWTKLSQYIR